MNSSSTCRRKSIVCRPVDLFAKLVEFTTYVKASEMSAEGSVNRATLIGKLTIQVINSV